MLVVLGKTFVLKKVVLVVLGKTFVFKKVVLVVLWKTSESGICLFLYISKV